MNVGSLEPNSRLLNSSKLIRMSETQESKNDFLMDWTSNDDNIEKRFFFWLFKFGLFPFLFLY